MDSQGQVLVAQLRAGGWWPTAEQAATRTEGEWRAEARDRVKVLEGSYLVAAVWVTTALWLAQVGEGKRA